MTTHFLDFHCFLDFNWFSCAVQVLEFGTGDGGPVIASLSGSSFQGMVHGFEINEHAAAIASKRAAESGLQKCFQVTASSLGMTLQTLQPSCGQLQPLIVFSFGNFFSFWSMLLAFESFAK